MLGFEVCVEACKSLILSCAVFEGRLEPEAAAELARLEVRYQVSPNPNPHTHYTCSCVCPSTDWTVGRGGVAAWSGPS